MYLTEGVGNHSTTSVVTAEEEVDALVGVYPKELTDDLDGEDLRVGKLRSGSTASDAPFFEPVIHERQKTQMMKVLRSTREDLL
jgi:hypothetical protein